MKLGFTCRASGNLGEGAVVNGQRSGGDDGRESGVIHVDSIGLGVEVILEVVKRPKSNSWAGQTQESSRIFGGKAVLG